MHVWLEHISWLSLELSVNFFNVVLQGCMFILASVNYYSSRKIAVILIYFLRLFSALVQTMPTLVLKIMSSVSSFLSQFIMLCLSFSLDFLFVYTRSSWTVFGTAYFCPSFVLVYFKFSIRTSFRSFWEFIFFKQNSWNRNIFVKRNFQLKPRSGPRYSLK